jgi:hypothetical protein
VGGAETISLALNEGESGVGIGFGQGVFDEVVEAGLSGLVDVGGDELAACGYLSGEAGEVAAAQSVFFA